MKLAEDSMDSGCRASEADDGYAGAAFPMPAPLAMILLLPSLRELQRLSINALDVTHDQIDEISISDRFAADFIGKRIEMAGGRLDGQQGRSRVRLDAGTGHPQRRSADPAWGAISPQSSSARVRLAVPVIDRCPFVTGNNGEGPGADLDAPGPWSKRRNGSIPPPAMPFPT